MKQGKSKGFIPNDDNRLINAVLTNKMFTQAEREIVENYVKKHLKEVQVDISSRLPKPVI